MNGWTAYAADKYGEFYAEYDDNCGLWCVFGTESGFCYSTYLDEGEATREADRKTLARYA